MMHNGVIQQSDTPWAIYHQPANQFVASFVGSNNFLPLSLSSGFIEFCGVVTDMPADSIASVTPDGAVVAIRPERVRLDLFDKPQKAATTQIRFPATVQYHSFAGRELRLTVQATDGASIQIIIEPNEEYVRLAEGDTVWVIVDKADLSFFHANKAGLRL